MSHVIPQEQRPLIDRMREAVPELEWHASNSVVLGYNGNRTVVSANPERMLLCDFPPTVRMPYPGDDEAVRIVREWWDKTHPQPTRDPITERGERLKALLPMLEWTPGTDAGNSLWLARDMHTEVVTIGSDWVTAFTRRQGRKHQDAISKASFATTDELIALLTKWRDATYPQAIDKVMVNSALLRAISRGCPGIDSIVNNGDAGVLVSFAGITKRFVASGSDWWEEVGDPDNTQYRQEHIVDLINAKLARVSSHEKAETMTPEYRQFIDKVSEFVEAKWSLKDGDLICEARGREYAINHRDGKYTLRGTTEGVAWSVFGISDLDRAVAALRYHLFQPTTKDRRASLADGIKRYLHGAVVSEGGAENWLSVDYEGARVAVTIDDRYTIRVRGHTLGVSTDTEEGAIRIVRDTLLAEAQRIEHERVEAEIASIAPILRQTPVQSDTQRNDVIATFMAGTRAMQGILDAEGIDANLLRVVGQMDQYHVLNLTDPRTRKKHVIAYDGQWYLDGEPIIFDELLNEVLAIVTLEEEQEEMSTRKTRAELAVDGAYLGAAKTAADNARDGIAAMVASNLPEEKQENARNVIADLLQSKAGSGVVAWLLGEAINQLPNTGPKAEKFADSLMIVGAMQGTEQVLDAVVEPLKALVSGVVESLPEPEKVRAVADETHEEAHEAPRRGKRAHA